jgi:hypothetical protein
LAAIGVYGVTSYAVSRRTHELGIRIALGATPRDALALVVRHALILASSGIAAGALSALLLTRLVAKLLYATSPTDVAVFVGVPAMLLGGSSPGIVPARQARDARRSGDRSPRRVGARAVRDARGCPIICTNCVTITATPLTQSCNNHSLLFPVAWELNLLFPPLVRAVGNGGTEMAVDDYVDSKVGLAVAATAVIFSPRVRDVMRRGAVYGLAGVLRAGDAITAFARGVGRGMSEAGTAALGDGAATVRRRRSRPTPTRRTRRASARTAGETAGE